jgi:hypothetical protein
LGRREIQGWFFELGWLIYAQLAAEASELFNLSRAEAAELLAHGGHVGREEPFY